MRCTCERRYATAIPARDRACTTAWPVGGGGPGRGRLKKRRRRRDTAHNSAIKLESSSQCSSPWCSCRCSGFRRRPVGTGQCRGRGMHPHPRQGWRCPRRRRTRHHLRAISPDLPASIEDTFSQLLTPPRLAYPPRCTAPISRRATRPSPPSSLGRQLTRRASSSATRMGASMFLSSTLQITVRLTRRLPALPPIAAVFAAAAAVPPRSRQPRPHAHHSRLPHAACVGVLPLLLPLLPPLLLPPLLLLLPLRLLLPPPLPPLPPLPPPPPPDAHALTIWRSRAACMCA